MIHPEPGAKLSAEDWKHRLLILWAWRQMRCVCTAERDKAATYRAVLDGCAVTIRALCDIIGVSFNFRANSIKEENRTEDLLKCCKRGKQIVDALIAEDQRCVAEVLYLANRAVAHPADGDIAHKAGPHEMTVAINTVLSWLKGKSSQWNALNEVPQELLVPMPPLT